MQEIRMRIILGLLIGRGCVFCFHFESLIIRRKLHLLVKNTTNADLFYLITMV